MRFCTLIAVLFLGGCAGQTSPGPEKTMAPLPELFSDITGSTSKVSSDQWWTAFKDPVLEHAIKTSLNDNLDLQTAVLRISEANANIIVAGSGGLPSINFDTSFTRTQQKGEMKEISGPVDKSVYGASATWLIDVFGEVRSQVRSANASRRAVEETAAITRLALLSDISASYIDARYYQALGAIADSSVKSSSRTLKLTRALEREGVGSKLDVENANQAVIAAEVDMPALTGGVHRATNRMATLMGKPAGSAELLNGFKSQPMPTFNPSLGFPADLVRNRPDIRKAEAELEAAVADIGYARSQLYPSITLSGSITPSYISTNAKSGSLTTWGFGPSLRLPIFEGGRLRANVKIAALRAQQKELAWRQSVLKAIEEVENTLTAFNREKSTLQKLEAQATSSRKTVYLSERAFSEGMTSLLEVLNAERQMLEVETKLAESRRNLALQFVALNIAVGKGLLGPNARGQSESLALN